MVRVHFFLLVIAAFAKVTLQDVSDNEVDEKNPFVDAAADFLQNQDNLQNLGSLVGNFIQSGGGKQIGDLLMGAATNNGAATAQILQGLGAMMNQNAQGGKPGLDPALLGTVLSMVSAGASQRKTDQGFDPSSLISMAGSFLSQEGNLEAVMEYLPDIAQTVGSFFGVQGDFFSGKHEDHAWSLPPILERVHVLFEQFINSEGGRNLINVIGAEKFIKIFSDENGNFNYDKFIEMLENHSFRRHWISMVTSRLASGISYVSDPKIQKKYLSTIQYVVNNFLKTQGYPKTAFFDPARPTESLSALVNYGFKKYFNYKISSKQYVKPAVEYVQEVFRLGQSKGFISKGMDSRELSHKLTDTINLEIIEPIARVNRAYRFAKKVPKCDRYVMCLVNQESPGEQLSLPGLKSVLSRGSSMFASWFLSSHTETSFWELYSVISEGNNCKVYYKEDCNGFHIEEIKVTTEYVHTEL